MSSVWERILAGELDPDSAPVQEAALHDPALAEKLEGLEQIATELDRCRDMEEAILAEASRAGSGPLEEATAEQVHTRLARRSVPGARWSWWALAAASLIVLFAWRSRIERDGRLPQEMLGATITLSGPDPAPAGFGMIHWQATELPAGGFYQLTVRTDEAGSPGRELSRVRYLQDSQWKPTPDESANWPDAVLVRVEAFDATGEVRLGFSSWYSLRRSPR